MRQVRDNIRTKFLHDIFIHKWDKCEGELRMVPYLNSQTQIPMIEWFKNGIRRQIKNEISKRTSILPST